MKADIDIAQDAEPLPITEVAAKAGLSADDIIPYGRHMAKVPLDALERLSGRPEGKLVLVTAMTATKAGEGKTVTSIGLVQALGRLGVKVMGSLREPSLGPVFGIKGGATGGGMSQVYPMWDIDLHFTGDIHAVTAAHNLLSAMAENHLASGNELRIDAERVVWPKAMDANCRELRSITVGHGKGGGVERRSSFIITAASEISAILALATSAEDLRARLERVVVAYDIDGRPVTAGQLKCVGAMVMLLKDAICPNLVQTLEGQPVLIHGFPFANIAHGNSSVLATRTCLKLADITVTEGGFAADLGAEKFFDIVCRQTGLRPDCSVIVASIRALRVHGGDDERNLGAMDRSDLGPLAKGMANLERHVSNVGKYGLPAVVALNLFPGDAPEEIRLVRDWCAQRGVECATSEVFAKGGEGGLELAEAVLKALKKGSEFRMLYDDGLTMRRKVETIASEIYGADGVDWTEEAERDLDAISEAGYGSVPVCIAKTQLSISDDPKLKGAPTGWRLKVREVRLSAGAGFAVPLCGDIMLMPGLPKKPAAERMDYVNGRITGLS